MKKMIPFLLLICGLLSGCSSVSLISNSAPSDYGFTASQKVLVAAKSPNLDLRKQFENAVAAKLQSKGMNAVTAWQEFPKLNSKSANSKDQEQLVSEFKSANIESIVVIALHDKIENYDLEASDYTEVGTSAKKNYYGVTFIDYYDGADNLPQLRSRNTEITPEPKTQTYTDYILEAVVYSLNEPKGKRHAGTILVKAENPEYLSEVLKGFTSILGKELIK